jgi:DNA-binding beta-propeller fold protein YncE
VAALLNGCVTPQGVLFEPIDPPKVWPPAPDTPRIKLVGALAGSDDLKAATTSGEAFRRVLRGPRPPIKFSGPHAVAVRSEGLLAVADGAGAAVHIIDLEERTHRFVTGWGDEHFNVPLGIAWAGSRLFVTDARRHEVIELDAKGRFCGRFGADVLKRPVGIAFVAKRNQLYVVDGGAHQIKVFDLTGRFVTTVGRPGVGPGEFNYPSHISCAGSKLVVADSGSFRVQWLDLDGQHIRTVGHKGDGAGDFSLPKGVAVDSEGHLYVVDAQFENIQVFNSEGRLLMAFGEEGRKPGQFWLPAGLAIDEQDRIWVADSGNRRIQVFAYMRADL